MIKIKPIHYIAVIILLIAVIFWQNSNITEIKSREGEFAEYKIKWLQIHLKYGLEELSAEKIPEKQFFDMTSLKFSDNQV